VRVFLKILIPASAGIHEILHFLKVPFSWMAASAAMRRVGGLILALGFITTSVYAQTHSQVFDYAGFNTYWNGSAWTSFAAGYGNVLGPNTTTGDFTLYSTGNAASVGLARTLAPTMTVTAAGTVSATRFVGDGSGLTNLSAGSVSVADGLSGSLVFRDGLGALHGHPGISVSSTTGSVGIGAGAPANIGNNGLYAAGTIRSGYAISAGTDMYLGNTGNLYWNSLPIIQAEQSSTYYVRFLTSNTEAMRIVSNGYVGIGTNAPKDRLDISGNAVLAGEGAYLGFGSYWDQNAATWRNRLANRFGANIRIGQQSSGQGGDIEFHTESNSTASTVADTAVGMPVRLVIRRAGDVRIGGNTYIGSTTVTPTTPLEVAGTVSATNIQIAGTMRLGVYTSQPVACGAGYIGLMAMNSATDVCVCNGTSWNRVSSGGTACSW
jgi:hypothetical protein